MRLIDSASLAALVVSLGAAHNASATVIVNFDPQQSTVTLGDVFNVDIRADMDLGIAGFGMLFNIQDPTICHLTAAPQTGPAWWSTTDFTPQGWRIGGLAFPDPVEGVDVLLATLSFHADHVGETDLVLTISPDDLTQGFALGPPFSPGNFDFVTLNLGHVTVIDVPAPAALALFAVAGLTRPRMRR